MSAHQLPLDVRLREDATFDSYVGEAGARLRSSVGIVYLWGEAGTGRTHLLQAKCHDGQARKVSHIYLSGLSGHQPEILEGLESIDLVCIDDLDEVIDDRSWQLALFHLVNAIRDHEGTLVLASTERARDLDCALDDLKSRLVGAQSIETDRLDDEAKLDLLGQKARRQGFELSDEVARFILQRADRNMHRLLELFEKLEVETLRQQRKVTIPFVKRTLEL
jgi:DnaA family protein